MSTVRVTWLDLLHELCLQNGWALLLTAQHHPAGFAEKPQTELRNLDVIEWRGQGPKILTAPRRELLLGGELIVRCDLGAVGGDLQAAAELLVGLLTRTQEQAA